MQPLQVIAAVVFQGKRLPQPQKTDPRYVAARVSLASSCRIFPAFAGVGVVRAERDFIAALAQVVRFD